MTYEQLDLALEEHGAKDCIGCVNWQEEYPYKPDCVFAIAHSKTHLAILYHVRGLDLRSQNLEDNGRVWEDSCCEFFVSDGSGNGTYWNFELNCVGTLLNGNGSGRTGRVLRDPSELKAVKRFSTLPRKQVELSGKIFGWSAGLVIPFEMIGINPDKLPKSLRANFYKCGDLTAHTHFLSWSPIGLPKPDFHRPEFFGEIEL